MSVATTEAGVIRTGDGVVLEFSFLFEARFTTDIKVGLIIGSSVVDIDSTGYVVALNPSGTGGTVTFTVAPTLGEKLYIYRDTSLTQLVEVSSQNKYNPTVVETVWDKLTFIVQELSAKLVRAVLTTPDEDPALLLDSIFSYKTDAELAAVAAGVQAMAAAASAAEALAKQNSMLRARQGWVTATAYAPSDIVRSGNAQYICLIAHTSGVFATDLAASRWQVWLLDGAPGPGSGDMLGGNNLSELTNKPLALSTLGGQPVDDDLTALAGVVATGLLARTGAGAAAARAITAGAGISVADGDGVAGNPTISVSGIQWQTPITVSSGTSSNLSTTIPATVKKIYVRFRGVQLTTGDNVRLRIGPSGGLVTSGYLGGSTLSGSNLAFTSGFGMLLSNIGRVGSGVMRLVKASSNIWLYTMGGYDTGGSNGMTGHGEVDAGGVVSQAQISVTGGAFTGTGTWQIGWE